MYKISAEQHVDRISTARALSQVSQKYKH